MQLPLMLIIKVFVLPGLPTDSVLPQAVGQTAV